MKKIVALSALVIVVGLSVSGSTLRAQASVYDKYVEQYRNSPSPTAEATDYTIQDSANDVQGAIRIAATYGLIMILGFYLIRWIFKRVQPREAAQLINSNLSKGVVIVVVVLAVLGGMFYYWFGMRPANIRKECLKVMGREPNFASEYQVGKYKACLIEHGLTP